MAKSAKTTYVYVSLYYALVFMASGAFYNYIGLYYNEIHLDNFTIGMLTSVGSIIALFAQPLFGLAADRAKSKNRILLLCLLLTATSIWLVPLSGTNLWPLLLSTALFGVFQSVINPLSDTIALELASESKFNFSRVRTVGSIGFAAMAAFAGWIFENNIHYMFPLFSVVTFIALLFAYGIPTVEGHQRKSKVKLKELFRNKPLVIIYIYTFIICTTSGFFYTFHAIYSQQQGVSISLIGIGIMIGSISQFPFMLYFDRLYERFGLFRILLVSGVFHVVRWLLYAVAINKFTVILAWVLHGGTFILFYLCLAEYVNRHVQKELKASGQMVNSIMILGITRIFGGMIGGVYASLFGIGSGFAVCAVICVAAIIGFAWYAKKHLQEEAIQHPMDSMSL